jgi:hypothetical protein
MPTKKKSKPSFNVPADIGSGRDSGWVYRSASEEEDLELEENDEPETGLRTAFSLPSAIAAMMQVATLSLSVATIPLVIGLGALGAIAGMRRRPEDT